MWDDKDRLPERDTGKHRGVAIIACLRSSYQASGAFRDIDLAKEWKSKYYEVGDGTEKSEY